MAIYIPKYEGYIVDNPDQDFTRCDGVHFHFDEVNTASISRTNNVVTITGGQKSLPLAYIETDKTVEITFASSLFTMDIFMMANNAEIEVVDAGVDEATLVQVETGPKVVLPFEVETGSVYIRGLEETEEETAAEGKFKVAITASTADTAGKTEITLNASDVAVGDEFRVFYTRRVVNGYELNEYTDSTMAKGSLTAHWPLYSSGTDCSEATLKGMLHWLFYKVRATAAPGFDNSLTKQVA